MAQWINRKEAATARHRPKPRTKHEERVARVSYRTTCEGGDSDLLDTLPDLVTAPAPAKPEPVKPEVKRVEAEKAKAKAEAEKPVDYSKDFGEESPGEAKDAEK